MLNSEDFNAPGHFYSPLPSKEEVQHYLASRHYQQQCARVDAMLDYGAMGALWERIKAGALTFPRDPDSAFRYHAKNSQFLFFDATIGSALVAHLNPKRIIEIGCGFSSAMMFDTLERMDNARIERFVCIDPDMSRLDELRPPEYVERRVERVQDTDPAVFETLEPGDIFFIDSSHVLKTGSDVHYEYLHILPHLPSGVIVHIHDIFYPLEYPAHWLIGHGRAWNECYTVDMMLSHGANWEVMFFNHAVIEQQPGIIRSDPDLIGCFDAMSMPYWHHRVKAGSIWLRKR